MKMDNTDKQIFAWMPLTDIKQLDEIDARSHDEPVFILKHSTRCGISHAALDQVEQFAADVQAPIYVLDLLAHRDISNHIAERYNEPHASPQLFRIKDGAISAKATHYSIDKAWMQKVQSE